jgi:hypothetical protein
MEFRTHKKNNLYAVFGKYNIRELAKKQAGLIVVKKRKFEHKGSKK